MCEEASKCRFKKNNFNVIVINFIKFHFDGINVYYIHKPVPGLCIYNIYTFIPSKESSDEQEGLYRDRIHKSV